MKTTKDLDEIYANFNQKHMELAVDYHYKSLSFVLADAINKGDLKVIEILLDKNLIVYNEVVANEVKMLKDSYYNSLETKSVYDKILITLRLNDVFKMLYEKELF